MDRLETIVSMIRSCHRVADIGTDHGYVPEMLLKRGIAKEIIATDINKGPLDRALTHLRAAGLEGSCQFRLGGGLSVLEPGEADCIIIAGMGGELISAILDQSPQVAGAANQLILQPMTASDKLRKYLRDNGYCIKDECSSKELHHYYFIIEAIAGQDEKFDDIYTEYSRHLIAKKDILTYKYMDRGIKKNEEIIASLRESGKDMYSERIALLEGKNRKIKELMNTCEA